MWLYLELLMYEILASSNNSRQVFSKLHTSVRQIASTKQHSALLCSHFLIFVFFLPKSAFDGEYEFRLILFQRGCGCQMTFLPFTQLSEPLLSNL